MRDLMNHPYDPKKDITAGELREQGFSIPDRIPVSTIEGDTFIVHGKGSEK